MQNKVVIITGGSSGIGKALAFEYGKNGSKIVITGRKKETLRATSEELSSSGIANIYVVADVSIREDNQKVIDATLTAYGKIDILINNAGISMRGMFKEVDPDVLKTVMDINYMGTVYATKFALPEIIKNKGSIIGISSIAGFRGLPVRTGYSASKFAMNGFLEALRTELLYDGVNVLTACPGFTTSNIRVAALDKNGNVAGETVRNEEDMMSAESVATLIYKATVKRKRTLVLTNQGKLTVFLNKFMAGIMDKIVYSALAKETNSPLSK
jgi:short-subunit dehydrogenase